MTYASSVLVDIVHDMTNVDTGALTDRRVYREVLLCKIPVMVRSCMCYLHKTDNHVEECRRDMGGYFIINGVEKVVLAQEKLRTNFPYVFPTRGRFSHFLEIRSCHELKACPLAPPSPHPRPTLAQECKHILASHEHTLLHDGVAVLRYGVNKTQCRVTYLAAALGDDVSPDEISCSPGKRCDNCSLRDAKKCDLVLNDCRLYLTTCRRLLENDADGRLTPKQLVTAMQKEHPSLLPSTMSTTTGAMCDLVHRLWDEGYLLGACVQLQFGKYTRSEVYVSLSTDFDSLIAANTSIRGAVWQPKKAVRHEAAAQHRQITHAHPHSTPSTGRYQAMS